MSMPDKALLREAAEWLLKQQEGALGAQETQQLDAWRTKSPAHAAAWARAQGVQGMLSGLADPLARGMLGQLALPARRRALRSLIVLAMLLPPVWLLARSGSGESDFQTAKGEQRRITLPDGSQLLLNTDSALQLAYGSQQRGLVLLQGEAEITTAADARPLRLTTAFGTLQPMGTRFSVRLYPDHARLQVSAGRVAIRTPGGLHAELAAGQQADFRTHHIGTIYPLAAEDTLWTEGMLLVEDWPLQRLLAELARYRPGVLHCDPDIASRRVSGAFPLHDTDAALALLQHSHQLEAWRLTRYFVRLSAR